MSDFQTIKARFIQELKADKKRTAILAVVVVAGAFVGLRLALKSTPARASASMTPVVADARPVASNAAAQASNAGTSQRPAAARLNEYLSGMKDEISRDLFAVNEDYFPMQKVVEAPLPPTVKPVPATASAPSVNEERQADRRMVINEAKSLNLQSTMVGDSAIASINGKILRVGEWFSGFQIVAITSHSCDVVKRNVKVTLEIQKQPS